MSAGKAAISAADVKEKKLTAAFNANDAMNRLRVVLSVPKAIKKGMSLWT